MAGRGPPDTTRYRGRRESLGALTRSTEEASKSLRTLGDRLHYTCQPSIDEEATELDSYRDSQICSAEEFDDKASDTDQVLTFVSISITGVFGLLMIYAAFIIAPVSRKRR